MFGLRVVSVWVLLWYWFRRGMVYQGQTPNKLKCTPHQNLATTKVKFNKVQHKTKARQARTTRPRPNLAQSKNKPRQKKDQSQDHTKTKPSPRPSQDHTNAKPRKDTRPSQDWTKVEPAELKLTQNPHKTHTNIKAKPRQCQDETKTKQISHNDQTKDTPRQTQY